MGRLKTGTCPRVDAKSIDFSVLEIQDGDVNPKAFSFRSKKFQSYSTSLLYRTH